MNEAEQQFFRAVCEKLGGEERFKSDVEAFYWSMRACQGFNFREHLRRLSSTADLDELRELMSDELPERDREAWRFGFDFEPKP